jgi:small GTP-binding protein
MARKIRAKIIMLGDSGTGKTSIVQRMCHNVFSPEHNATIGGQFVSLTLCLHGETVALDIWDTAGQEGYRALVSFYTRDAQGAILVADPTDGAALLSLPKWITFVRSHVPQVKILLFANKDDLANRRVVSLDELAQFARDNDCGFAHGSAKTGQGVPDVFERIAESIQTETTPDASPSETRQLTEGDGSKEACC